MASRQVLAGLRVSANHRLPPLSKAVAIVLAMAWLLGLFLLPLSPAVQRQAALWAAGPGCARTPVILKICTHAASHLVWVSACLFTLSILALLLTRPLLRRLVKSLLLVLRYLSFPVRLAGVLGRECRANWRLVNDFAEKLSPRLDAIAIQQVFQQASAAGVWQAGMLRTGCPGKPGDAFLRQHLPVEHWAELSVTEIKTAALVIRFIQRLEDPQAAGRLVAGLASEVDEREDNPPLALACQLATLSAAHLGEILGVVGRLDAANGTNALVAILSAAQILDENASSLYLVALVLAPVQVCEAALANIQV